MNDMLINIGVLFAGLALGTFFFGGLWFTVKKGMASKIPALWFVLSFFIRTGITLAGFYFCSQGNLQRLLICLFGFMIARILVKHFTKPKEEKELPFKKEISHEA